ncbi:MAG: hypothetical protein PHE06_08460 [Lachnospiraceae bacterium]|nr:hypothetical protein [Lachnospiraceae bacterium]
MKKKYLAIMLGCTLAISPMAVFAEATATTETEAVQEAAAETEAGAVNAVSAEDIVGEVKTIDEDSITVAVGTLKGGMGQPMAVPAEAGSEAVPGDAGKEAAPADAGEGAPSKLDLTGEEKTIAITEDTLVYREIAPEVPKEGADASAEASTEEATADASAEASAEESTADASAEASAEEAAADASAEASAEAVSGFDSENAAPEMALETEACDISELAEGDIVTVTLDADGNAAMITIHFAGQENGAPKGEKPEDKQPGSETELAQEDVSEADIEEVTE